MNPIYPALLPAPHELGRRKLWPRLRQVRMMLGMVRHDGRVRFAVGFLMLVTAGTLMMHWLEGGSDANPFSDFFNDFWFTMVTITSVGYGDITPTLPGARAWAMVEMVVGVTMVGVLTGAIASALVESNRRRAMGLAPLAKVRDHIVVCGWKRDMREILLGILEAEPSLTSWDLVLVTTQPPNEIGDLRRERRLRAMHYVYGNHTDRETLETAQIRRAQRVIILADESGRRGGSDPDSRTVLAATAVEAISSEVYTCTEIVQPHFVNYLRPAGVEEVVLEARNARALIVSASLGHGLANIMPCFLPEQGQQLRVLDIPDALVGGPYEELDARARERGYLPLGVLENTGGLYDRQHERIAEALRRPDYREAVDVLISAANLVSNVPTLAPRPQHGLRSHSKLIVLLPSTTRQPADQLSRRRMQRALPRPAAAERLLLCGWKPDMVGHLLAIQARHGVAGRPLAGLTVVARLPEREAEQIAGEPGLESVRVVMGDPTDPVVLRRGDVGAMDRVLILADASAELSPQEVDARSVMISFAVTELNPSAYKSVELLNPNFGEHLRVANVEEAVYTSQYQRLMLVQASLGTGLASALGALFDPGAARLRVVDFPDAPSGTPFAEHARALAAQDLLLIGVMEHTGNSHVRKTGYVRQAQGQSGVKDAVEHLLRLKGVQTNRPVLNPDPAYLPGAYSRALVVAAVTDPLPT